MHPFSPRLHRLWRAVAVFATVPVAVCATAPVAGFSGSAQAEDGVETASRVEVLVEARTASGRLPGSLESSSFVVSEDGAMARVVSVQPLARTSSGRDSFRRAQSAASDRPWQVLVYVDAPLASEAAVAKLAGSLGRFAAELTALGPVEVVVAAPQPEIWLGASRDPKLVQTTLEGVVHRELAEETLGLLRHRFVDLGLQRLFRDTDPAGWELSALRRQIRSAAAAEGRLVEERLETLRWWLLSYPPSVPKALLWISEGYDLDPARFYLAGLPADGFRRQLEEDLLEHAPGFATQETAKLAGALGWTVLPLWNRSVRQRLVDGDNAEAAVLVAQSTLLVAPEAPLEIFASYSAGDVLTSHDLERSLASLHGRWVLAYEVERPADDALHRVEIGGGRLEIRTPPWRSTPASIPALSKVLRGSTGAARGLDLRCEIAEGTAEQDAPLPDPEGFRLVCDLRLGPGAQGDGPDLELLLTLFARGVGGLRERIDVRVPAPRATEIASGIHIETAVPGRFRGRELTVVLTDERSGRWSVERLGTELAGGLEQVSLDSFSISGTAPAAADSQAASPPRPAPPKAIHLTPFDAPMVAGAVLVEAQVTRPAVSRVDFYLDGRRVASADSRPFEGWLRLGSLPEPHAIAAVAVGAAGDVIGRDEMLVNQGLGRHRVRIKEPLRLGAAGDYDVEIEVDAPPSTPAERVELYWNDSRLTRFAHPPYRIRVRLDPVRNGDYLRAVARFRDGTSDEDTVLKSKAGFAFSTDVELIELYTVIKDAYGRPVTDLRRQEVTILEEGRRQTLHSFERATDVPLALSLTIDISESMHDRMPMVQAAAQEFIDALLEPQDRVVLTAFNHRPFLLQGPVTDPDLLSHDIERLPTVGGTSLFDAIIYSLLQLRDLSGRKAVVLLTDGKDKHSRFSFNQALQFARKASIPVYLIGLDAFREVEDGDEAVALKRLAALTGGGLYVVRSERRLDAIYTEIAAELRNQYVLSYQSDYGGASPAWRSIELRIARSGARAQTIAGYFPSRR